jgi:hypothetical protein
VGYTFSMPTRSKEWGSRLAILSATCFGVFVLPLLLPPAYIQGVSASNLAGFNNKVAALAAACLGTLVFFLGLKWPRVIGLRDVPWAQVEGLHGNEYGRLSRGVVSAVVLLWGSAIFLFGLQIIRLGIRYLNDWGYFIDRAGMYEDFGRRLYTQIEFSYGPLLFYSPVIMRAALRPFHVSEAGSYLATLVVLSIVGLLLMVYVIDHLPMSRRWKTVIFLLFAIGMFIGNMGINYTPIRFVTPLALLVMVSQRERAWAAALWIFAGQALCLGLSPEIGFAFLVSSFAYALYLCFTRGRAWGLAVVASLLSTTAFLLVAGGPYLRMVGMISRGVYGFPVEPLPYILLFLFAMVWLVPVRLAGFFRQRRPEAPMLAAFYVVSLALLPAAFGRADPGHVLWDGLAVFLLSAVAISSEREWEQIAWGGCLTITILWMCNINRRVNWFEIKPVLCSAALDCRAAVEGRKPMHVSDDRGFSLSQLQAIVGHDPVATPEEIPLSVERALRESGQYTPTFYNFSMSLLDAGAEERQIQDLNKSEWALIPAGKRYGYVERPEDLKFALGIQLPYRTRRPVYAVGLRLEQNLAENWRVRGRVGEYLVYEHMTGRPER